MTIRKTLGVVDPLDPSFRQVYAKYDMNGRASAISRLSSAKQPVLSRTDDDLQIAQRLDLHMKRISKPFLVEIKKGRGHVGRVWPPQEREVEPVPSNRHQERAPVVAQPWRQARILPALAPPSVEMRAEIKLDPEPAEVEAELAVQSVKPQAVATEIFLAPPKAHRELEIASAIAIIKRTGGVAKPSAAPREAFRRGERWRHRLPPVIQRPKR